MQDTGVYILTRGVICKDENIRYETVDVFTDYEQCIKEQQRLNSTYNKEGYLYVIDYLEEPKY